MKMLDLHKRGGRYYFRVDSSPDFHTTIGRLKASFPFPLRDFHPDTKEWSVPVTSENELKLMEIFENGYRCITLVKAQLMMF